MYHRVRRKMHWHYTFIAILIFDHIETVYPKSIDSTGSVSKNDHDYSFDNNIIDFDSAYDDKFSKKYGITPWNSGNNFNKESHRYTVIPEVNKDKKSPGNKNDKIVENNTSTTTESSEVPKELISTTEDVLIALIESTAVPDLTVIPLSTTQKTTTTGMPIEVVTATLPSSTQNSDTSTNVYFETTEFLDTNTTDLSFIEMINTTKNVLQSHSTTTYKSSINDTEIAPTKDTKRSLETTTLDFEFLNNTTDNPKINNATVIFTPENQKSAHKKDLKTNATNKTETISRIDDDSSEDTDVPIFTELDLEDAEVLEDYYDGKDVVPTKPPNNDALSIIFGLAGSVVESMAERVVPKGIFDIFKRMQKQNEALEAERLRSREENGGLGQFGRGILKSISTGLSKPFTQLMESTRDKGSLDSDRGFVASVASGVSSVATAATSLVDQFKTRVQAIYPGTIWCGDGHSAQARSSDLGLFFFTDTCCRQHDACKLYIRSGDTKYGLTNTGLFTRSHCSCDANFRKCLLKTNSLVSGQIGLTYFNVLGPQCFRKAHPIVRCVRRTRITGQKCEEYELDYTKPKMWQWFDNETF